MIGRLCAVCGRKVDDEQSGGGGGGGSDVRDHRAPVGRRPAARRGGGGGGGGGGGAPPAAMARIALAGATGVEVRVSADEVLRMGAAVRARLAKARKLSLVLGACARACCVGNCGYGESHTCVWWGFIRTHLHPLSIS